MRLIDIAPLFAEELAVQLSEVCEPMLAAQIADLCVVDRCRCQDEFCGSFYTATPPLGAYGTGHRNVALEPESGMVILDVVHDRIMFVEVLFNNEFRKILRAALP